ncbi:MAG: cobaltochelatase CobN [Desulfobacteraceae bacterium Eth-SRB2]|nr:MAG: cobaltochelatase CobN [Desulfobacteraceae bacterium Eth-SRB2]
MNIPWIGYYHGESERIFREFNDYRIWYENRSDSVRYESSEKIGIFFPRTLFIKKNMDLIDLLIRELENRKIFPVPVFAQKKEYGGPDCPDPEAGLELLKGVDLIINCESSYLLQTPIGQEAGATILEKLDVPIIQTVYSSSRTEEEWKKSPQGIHPSGQVYWVAQPEFNGTIEPIVISARDEKSQDPYGLRKPIPERVNFLLDRACSWLKLGRLPVEKRRVTFLLHKNPCAGVEASVAGGAGLDTLESVARIMQQMQKKGYAVANCPESGKELIDIIMDRKAICEFRWTTVDEIVKKGGAIDLIDVDKYNQWLSELPQAAREKMVSGWGEPPGEGMVYNDKIVVTGVNFCNVNVLVEPKRGCYGARCDGKVCKILHDPTIPPTHQCLATYKWVQENSDVIISVGTHGYIEFLPGKGVGLSNECFPEIIVGDKPHLYIYTVKNNSEGILAKRRAYATLVDHMVPIMQPSGLYDELEEMEELLRQYANAKNLNEENRQEVIFGQIYALAEKTNLIDQGKEISQDVLVEQLHGKLSLFRETQIKDGLHILGQAPDEDQMANMLVSIMRFDGDRPSIRRLILELMGYKYEEAIENKDRIIDNVSYGELLDKSTMLALDLVKRGLKDIRRLKEDILEVVKVKKPDRIEGLVELIAWAKDFLAPKLKMTAREIPQLLRGMDKKYIEPGASGLLTRGKIDVLPTGRNFYSVDTRTIPTRAAWEVGVKMADNLLHKYLHQEVNYPENVGMVLWAIDAYRADGEQIAQILYLMGAKPIWTESGIVKGTEPIPLKELKRPRIDVTIRTSGIFRDTLPHLIELIDETIIKIASLNEREEYNYIKKHVNKYREKERSKAKGAFDKEKVDRQATYRLFSARPGAYGGGGVSLMIAASAWETINDLGEQYIEKGGYAYGNGIWGEISHKEYADRLSTVDATFHKLASDESDPLDCCCFYDFHGGMYAAVKTVSGNEPKVYWGDTSDPQHPDTRDMKDEMERITRTKLLNPKWIQGMKRHGYKGASDIAKRVGRVYGWDASAEVVADWIFDDITKTFIINEENRKFFEENNPWALEEMARRLLEAEKRGVWKADPEVLKELQEHYLEIEGWMEEKMGDVEGDFQGGSIDVITNKDVKEWSKKKFSFMEEFK